MPPVAYTAGLPPNIDLIQNVLPYLNARSGWSQYVTVSPNGGPGGDGGDYGPNTLLNNIGPGTSKTCGIQEALNTQNPVFICDGTYALTSSITWPTFGWLEGRSSIRGQGYLGPNYVPLGAILVPPAGVDGIDFTQQGTVPVIKNLTIQYTLEETEASGINTIGTLRPMVNDFFFDQLFIINCDPAINLVNAIYGHIGYIAALGGSNPTITFKEVDAGFNYGNFTVDHLMANNLVVSGTTHILGENLIAFNHVELYPFVAATYGLSLYNCVETTFNHLYINTTSGSGSWNAIKVNTCNDTIFHQVIAGAGTPAVNVGGCGRTIFDDGAYAWAFTIDSSSLPTTLCRAINGVNFQGFQAGLTPGFPASGVTVQNTNPFPCEVFLLTTAGGGITAYTYVDINSISHTFTATVNPGFIQRLEPGEEISFTYGGAAGTWIWKGL